MKCLYINTATSQTTVALYEGSTVVAEKKWKSELDEAEKLQPAVDELLRSKKICPDDIEQLVVCVGPGGFTSSRIGVSAVNAWAFAKHLPVAQVSVFDLYRRTNTVLLVSTNSNEAWVQLPGEEPQFIARENMKISSPFSFRGILHEEWKKYLEEHGGTYEKIEEQLPSMDHLEFRHEIVKPWYYKDANITWSEKNVKRKT